jgi:hypothetical protein
MDISDTLAPNSDQLDAVDLLGSPPRIFTITEVSRGSAEQPVQIRLAEFPRWWRPSKGMRRVLANCWGKQASEWVGRRIELYCDPDVMFGKEKVGGIRISRLSHIDGPMSTPMIVGRGKGGSWLVKPLPDAEPTRKPADDPMTLMGARMKARGLTVKEDALAYVESIIGRAVASRDEMTPEEVAQVNEALSVPMGADE